MAKTQFDNDQLLVMADYREREQIKLVPGIRYDHRTQLWKLPLSWASLAALRGVFGDALTLDPDTVKWGWLQRTWIDSVATIKSEVLDPDTPFAFQETGVEFLRTAQSALLGDEMGLGKSRQAVLAVHRDDAYPCLVVCPNSMKHAWKDEWDKWTEGVEVVIVDGTAAQKRKALDQVGYGKLGTCAIHNATPASPTMLLSNVEIATSAPSGSVTPSLLSGSERTLAVGPATGTSDQGDLTISANSTDLGKTKLTPSEPSVPCVAVVTNSVSITTTPQGTSEDASVSVVTRLSKGQKAVRAGSNEQLCTCLLVAVVNWESLRSFSRLAPFGSTKLSDKQKEPGPLNRPWATVIADEAHRAKDPKSQQTRALWAVGQTADRRIALSGTPVANSPIDLWSVMHFVQPSDWPSRSAFIDRYCVASFNFWGGLDVTRLREDTRPELDAFFLPRFFRRTKQEVLPQLPPKTYQTRLVNMAPAQHKAYESLRKEMLAKLDSGILIASDPLTQTLRLLQTASALPDLDDDGGVVRLRLPSCKIAALHELLDECSGAPLVAFAASRKLIELASEEVGVDHVLITGAQTPAERAGSIARFQTGGVPLALVTLGAGGEGITLTAASRAAFLQRSWSLVQNLQAEDRIHRIGQEAQSVEIIDIVSANTLEARVMEAFAGKELTLKEVVRDPTFLRDILSS